MTQKEHERVKRARTCIRIALKWARKRDERDRETDHLMKGYISGLTEVIQDADRILKEALAVGKAAGKARRKVKR